MRWELFTNTLWDMFLAAVPAALAWLLTHAMGRTPARRLWLWAPAVLVWLLFVPNTCYLLTEFRHLRWRMDWDVITYGSSEGHENLRRMIRWISFYVLFSGFGLVTFVLAIRPFERFARERRLPVNALAPFFFWLVALGVYLGLRMRFNSWDVLRDPLEIVRTAWAAVTGPRPTHLYILTFAVLLWLLYLVLDIWVDGLMIRLPRWERRRRGRRAEPRAASGSAGDAARESG